MYYVAEERELSNQDWAVFTENLLEYQDWISAFSHRSYPNDEDGIPCLRVTTPGSEIALIIDTQGYDYARYVGIEESAAFWAGTYTLNSYKITAFNGKKCAAITNSVSSVQS